jgi:arylsulfatase
MNCDKVDRDRQVSDKGRNGRKDMAAKIGKTVGESQPYWPDTPRRPLGINKQGAPNILVVLFDDVGFSDFGCYGSPIATPTIDAIGQRGLRCTGFHTTAMCSTTRAALLTGRNHHSVGVGCLANFDSGYPGYRGKIATEAGTLAEMLRPAGYRNYMLGKWHVTPLTESGATGPFDGWPLGRGFDRFYGFMDAETDQYAPELVRDNTPVDPPGSFATGYHLTADLVDQAIRYLADHVADNAEVPWLTWVALGACHAPHQAPFDLIRKYDALFAEGWDAERERRLARQKETGIAPKDTRLPARNDMVRAWAELPEGERRLYTRLQAAYAAMLDHADQHLARLVAFLEQAGQLDDTMIVVMSDNGASQEGGPFGMVNAMGPFNLRREPIEEKIARIDDIGGPDTQYQLPAGLGDGSQHAVASLQAEHPWRRHPRSAGDLLAQRDLGTRRAAAPVLSCLRPGTDAARRGGREGAGRDQWGQANAHRGHELCCQPQGCDGAGENGAAIFRDVRPSRPGAGRLEGRGVPSPGHRFRAG